MLLLAPTGVKLWILADFTLHRDYIAENLCVNRGERLPLMCAGRCYLGKQLKQASEQEEGNCPNASIAKAEVLYCQADLSWLTIGTAPNAWRDAAFPPIVSLPGRIDNRDVFHPPRVG